MAEKVFGAVENRHAAGGAAEIDPQEQGVQGSFTVAGAFQPRFRCSAMTVV
jgi:hypothetical protein